MSEAHSTWYFRTSSGMFPLLSYWCFTLLAVPWFCMVVNGEYVLSNLKCSKLFHSFGWAVPRSCFIWFGGEKKCWVAGNLLLGWKAEEPRPVSPHPLRPPTSACMSGCDNYAPTSPLHRPHLACLFQKEEPRLGSSFPSAPAQLIDLPKREDW